MAKESIQFDLVSIGGGAAGLVSSSLAAGLGVKAALISDGHPGGECLWTGCVPSKALIHAGHNARVVQASGLESTAAERFRRAMEYMKAARARISDHDSVETVESGGVKVIDGRARFLSSRAIEVNGLEIRSGKFIIATGAGQGIPPVDGLKESGCLTHESILELSEPPEHLVILGGGPVGCEYAQTMARLGVNVTLVEMLDRLLLKEEPETSAFMIDLLEEEGVKVHAGHKAVSVRTESESKKVLSLEGSSGRFEVECDGILAATGKVPNSGELNLKACGVETDEKGFIRVNASQRTTAKNIWACGDVTGGYQFTHYADHQARIAALNACLGVPVKREETVVPWCTFTDPEIASVGMREAEAVAAFGSQGVFALKYDLSDFDRAILDDRPVGFIKAVINKKGQILGCSIVGARAGELIHEFALAMKFGKKIQDLSGLIHVYPSMSSAIRNASNLYYRTVMKDSWLSSLVKSWVRLRN